MFRWTAEELKKVIEMLKRPEFDSKEVDPDLHKRMNKAVPDGRIKCFNMRESNLDAGVAFQIGQLRYKQLFFKYILVCTSTYWYVLVHTCTY